MKSGGLPRLVPFSLPSCKRVSLRAHPLPFLKRVTLATSPWLCRPHFCSSPSFSTHTNGVNEDTEDGGPKPDEHFRHSQLNSMFRWLNERGPAFEVDPHRVQFLEQPSQFLDRLEEGIKQAQHRVVLSALYLGTSSPQVDRLMAALHSACRANSQLQVHLHFDHCRSTRDPKGLEELHRLQAAFPERVKVTLFQVPAPLWWQWGHRLVPSPRFKEVFGLSHIKAFLFDDDLILSGANLSTDYFTDRKDRYMVMEQAPALAHFFSRLMETVGDLSWHLDPRSKQVESNALLPKEEANRRLSSLLRDSSRLHPLPSSSSPPLNKQKGGATWVLPTLQMAPFGIRHDEEITSFLFRGSCDSSPSPPLSTFHISSAYLNFTERYTQDLLHFPSQQRTKQSIEILTAAPEANSFFGGSGVARHITHCYTCLERALFERIRSAGLENSIRLYEWQQGGPSSKKWTYHAKGLWLSPSPSSSSARVTILGSPNFGNLLLLCPLALLSSSLLL
ncbi:CDP-diacylglycerol--glycerol-3-phosphate 3-phosphatidyltransferase, variant 3 [Balamuthia mandrillaris]